MKIRLDSVLVFSCLAVGQAAAADPAAGRQFERISIHPNGQEWLVSECARTAPDKDDCFILHYDVASGVLGRYQLPGGYYYRHAAYAPSGHYIVMTRMPQTAMGATLDEDALAQAYEAIEIAVMEADGSDFHVLPLARGYKLTPVISPDNSKLAFWRGAPRPQGSKTVVHQHELREANLNGREEHPFAGEYGFFGVGQTQYLDGGTLLFNASYPSKDAEFSTASESFESRQAYEKRYGTSQVYRIARGQRGAIHPQLAALPRASHATADAKGNWFLTAELPGISAVRRAPDGGTAQWPWPANLPATATLSATAAPDGSKIFFIYMFASELGMNGRAIGQLDTTSGQWRAFDFPSWRDGIALPIRLR
ncbi:hypothetical protein [Pseudoduganella violacea]|uniref:Uncharacterized protein n=1 Tax=Pseudoduganella violacea TaxID=1715466 RepID=A0A7W5BAD8_9BURK|nr:hypothetical protein [Pseudoduganella violacea]MBB3119343.1 hypothetical protein [Pseudoduganella violacea]